MRVLGRGVAQPGSALAWGARGRRFKSSRPDQIYRVLSGYIGNRAKAQRVEGDHHA
jgi:hypothetical protein